ncbi:MAG: hypothetical protein IJ500_03570 [Alphaproteobacteria bacterium]|nr:hypothetical protein [Alphaproteobacteria bacterium]
MKKLTAGIFTVLIGLCAANSADAAIASKAWVEQYAVSGDTYTTDKSTLESSIATAKKAGDDAAAALGAYKTTNDAAVLANTNAISAINDQTTGILKQAKDYTDALANGQVTTNKNDIATLQENLQKVQGGQLTLGTDAVDSGNIKAGAVTEEKLSTELAGKVNAAQTSQQVATAITGALADYTTTADLQTNYLTKTDASTTYQTIGNMKNAISEGMTDAEKQATYPTIALLEAQIDSSAQDSAAELASVASDLGSLQQTVNTNKQAADAVAERVTTAEGEIDALQAADTTINNKIGTVAEGKTVVQMIADAQTAATYDDTDVKADIAANAEAIADEEARAKAAEEANATAAANAKSAADAAQTQADKGVTDAAAAKAVADAAIPAPTDDCTDLGAKCVLTVGTAGYAWELVERADNE